MFELAWIAAITNTVLIKILKSFLFLFYFMSGIFPIWIINGNYFVLKSLGWAM